MDGLELLQHERVIPDEPVAQRRQVDGDCREDGYDQQRRSAG